VLPKITGALLEAHLKCRYKAHLLQLGEHGEPHDYETLCREARQSLRPVAVARLLERHAGLDVPREVLLTAEVLRRGHPLLLGVTLENEEFAVRFDALLRADGPSSLGDFHYLPVLFHEAERPSLELRILLALYGTILGAVQGKEPAVGLLLYGHECKDRRIKFASVRELARRHLREIRETRGGAAPRLILNAHCQVCAFRSRCHAEATAKDELSLLRGMSEKEVEKYRKRGITTMTQLSHTYQPGRRGKRRTGKARKHDHALQALAIREKKVYVLDRPVVMQGDVALYLDIEGIPDRGFEYLFGLVAVKDGVCTEHSFWADDPSQEKAAWDNCLRAIEGFGGYTLYHYGSYESRFLERMSREAGSREEAAAIERIRSRSCNVLAAIYAHLYFPTGSNGLKDVGTFLGARWSVPNASGMQSLAWRLVWEASKDEATRQLLLTYNREDCLALRRVTEFVLSVCDDGASIHSQTGPTIASVEDLYQGGSFRFGKTQFFCPELEHINRCAYSDYQRERVYLRTSPAVRRSLRRKHRAARKRLKVNEVIECGGPQTCPRCGSAQVRIISKWRARLDCYDLRFTASGVKRWLVRCTSLRYSCIACGKTFYAAAYRAVMKRFGNNLASWVIYQHVALRLSFEDVNLSLNEVFGFQFTHSVMGKVKPLMARRHQATFERLKAKLRRGALIHADETRVRDKGRLGYVWAFTNLEETVYVYTPTREGTILEEMLEGFDGILVSDFYSAYDAPKCKQQKCLIHLIRDFNDDLLHNPFDEELKQLGQRLVALLKPIIDTIDRFGLKHYHLNKHKEEVARYFRYLAEQPFRSEVASKYQKRLQKYRDKLFVFLDYDGIPWNNNNAENAIKRFASRRKLIGSSFTERGLRDYLVFLSI
jgi:predicted RecB family nuclease